MAEPPREHRLRVSRSARVFSQGGERAREAWVLLHGYGRLAAPFLGFFRQLATAERLLVAPEGLSRFYLDGGSGKVGASWMTREGREHDIADNLAYLDEVRRQLVPPVPLTVVGFSQGVATAARWAAATTPRPARLIAWGSLLPEDVPAARLSGVAVTYVVGARDDWAPPDRVEAEAATLRNAGVAVEVIGFAGGHELDAEVVRRLGGPAPA